MGEVRGGGGRTATAALSSCKAWVARAAMHWQDSMYVFKGGGSGQWQSIHLLDLSVALWHMFG